MSLAAGVSYCLVSILGLKAVPLPRRCPLLGGDHGLRPPPGAPGGRVGCRGPSPHPGPPPAPARSLRRGGDALSRRTGPPPPGPGSPEPHAGQPASLGAGTGGGRDPRRRQGPPPAARPGCSRSRDCPPEEGLPPGLGRGGRQLRRGGGPGGGDVPVPAAEGGGAGAWRRAPQRLPGRLPAVRWRLPQPCQRLPRSLSPPPPSPRPLHRRRAPRPDPPERG